MHRFEWVCNLQRTAVRQWRGRLPRRVRDASASSTTTAVHADRVLTNRGAERNSYLQLGNQRDRVVRVWFWLQQQQCLQSDG